MTAGANTTGTAADAATASAKRIRGQIAAQRGERGRSEHEGRPVIDVCGIDPDARTRRAAHIAEGRPLEEVLIEPARELTGIVDAASNSTHHAERTGSRRQRLLPVTEQEAFAKVGKRGALFQAVVGGKDRTTGHPGYEVHAIDERTRSRAAGQRGALDFS
jgi:hypothetical protein